MLTERSMDQTLRKLDRFVSTLKDRMFISRGQATLLGYYGTRESLHTPPPETLLGPAPEKTWGEEGLRGWFHLTYTVPEELEGRALYVMPHIQAYESTLFLNGRIHSNFAARFVEGSHGNHWCNRLVPSAQSGETLVLDLECYCWHFVPGTEPLSLPERTDFTYAMGPVELCTRDEEITAFLFDLSTVLSLCRALGRNSTARGQVENALYEAHLRLFYDPDACGEDLFRKGLRDSLPFLKSILERRNGTFAPYVGLIGHSHMDTAWLWPIEETRKKCARTYAGQLNLMEEYPEYRFMQSSCAHGAFILEDQPEMFRRIAGYVREGRWEPNGGVWVECDCNITGGEYLIRQFLWGQRFTREHFGYTADAFWLPDTFGYSAALPQIILGCGLRYFLTTKISWNDTNLFPMTTFLWQGLDGSRVLTHFNRTHIGPTPETLMEVADGSDRIRESRTAPLRLFSFGRGDGGGGPEFEMLETARRLQDLEGLPRTGYTTVSDFMHRLEKEVVHPSVWSGELYLELHRGTLTNQHEIKRNNRLCENALHTLESALVLRSVMEGREPDETPVQPMMNTLLIHQFHDILPGTCIHSVHELARKAVSEATARAEGLTAEALKGETEFVLFNPLSFERSDTLHLPGVHPGQVYEDLSGETMTALPLAGLPPFAAVPVSTVLESLPAVSPFRLEGAHLRTPFAHLEFDEEGRIRSMVDLPTGRELVNGLPFNTFLMAEDLPASWDNWDLDADAEDKFIPVGHLLSRTLISDGPVEMRIRSVWQLTERTKLTQDMILDARTPLITFDTLLDWQDDHRFLKAAFDTVFLTDYVSSEIQFGYARRSTHRSTSWEKARFETCQHRYSDLSEQNAGLALLNDCKYALSVREGSMRLSLHKGGTRPDAEGDRGLHRFRYAILPHTGPLTPRTVIRPAAAFNVQPVHIPMGFTAPSLVKVDQPGILVDTVKPCEDRQRAYILRLYEAAGGSCRARLTFSHPVRRLVRCSMLEEEEETLPQDAELFFTPFHITTLKVCF